MFWRTNERRVLLMGVNYSGKTTLLYRWKTGEVVNSIPTIGFNVETIRHSSGHTFEVWEPGGSDKARPLFRHYYDNVELVIFLHNCADMSMFDEQLDWFKTLATDGELYHAPILVVPAVQDTMAPDTKTEDLAKIMAAYANVAANYRRPEPIKIFNCPGFSARTTENPETVLDEVAKMLPGKRRDATKPPDTKAPNYPPSASDVERAKTMTDADEKNMESFWSAFEDESLAPWDHYNHLKAGFFVLIETFEQGGAILDAAETFVGHLDRLRTANPELFRDESHRTMTTFWLAQLQVAAANYINSLASARPLQRDDFKNVLLKTPQLTDERLWSEHYSEDVLFTQDAKDGWCLPNLKPLPSVTTRRRLKAGLGPPAMTSDVDRLIGFGLTVVKQTMTSRARRGAIVKAALAALQSSTIQERAVNAAIPPYSETQAYFWVQMVHAAVAAANKSEVEKAESLNWSGSMESLTLPAFKALFGITGDEWREHYSSKSWNSLPARMRFHPPDKKPLPNVIAVHDKARVSAARGAMVESYASEKEPRSEMPPFKDLAVMAAVLARELKDGTGSDHGIMLQALFDLLRTTEEMKQDPTASQRTQSLAIAKALDIPCASVDGLTQRMFWVQQVLLAVGKFEGADFGGFVRANAHLAYRELPLVYYTSMLWASKEAEEVYIAPDRKSLRSLVI
ncbi:ARF-like GTPase ARLP2 [Akanthomyces lecanii RCEF 1005]|uniref:ARF-like GTPase ARLP2 n=1 Tax=Akanthomyces lecanii RCEF 1005 TaxID=1081108 RepID=A0A162KBE7_CORDF|nr:ARF-like GTPase ARLP2 [Akanthomyces lecanii RCEF 1005]